ncbi:MAG TPA: hypothetical protein VF023_07590 [Bryobacteraceae bacterium]|jgi:hypothetical protein
MSASQLRPAHPGDAKLLNMLTAEALGTIAFALIASDHFEWNDDVISEILQDCC